MRGAQAGDLPRRVWTRNIVEPCSWANATRRSRTDAPVVESRFPVGSSAGRPEAGSRGRAQWRHVVVRRRTIDWVGGGRVRPARPDRGARRNDRGVHRAPSGWARARLPRSPCGQRGDQVELLEHEAERAQPQVGEPAVGESREVFLLEQQLAAGRPIERAEQLQHRALSRPARPGDDDELTLVDHEVDVVDGRTAVEPWS